MIHTHYIKRRFLKPAYLFFVGVILLLLGAGMCFVVAPTTWIAEIVVVLLFGGGIVSVGASVPRYTKQGLTLAIWVLAIVLLRRFDLLSWISFAVTLVLVGVATLLY